MKRLISAIVFVALAGGCASDKKTTATAGGSPLDVGGGQPAAMATTYTPPQPVMVEPVLSATPAPAPAFDAGSVAAAAAAPANAAASYKVRHGDTLYKIARDRYGDGKQWQKIAMANPGVTPQSLKAGQTIVIP